MRKLISLILAVMMVLSLCSFATAAEEPITVTVFRGDPGDQPTSDNKIYKLIEEEFGIKFEIEFLAGDLDETLGTKLIGEDYPDLFDGGNSAEKLINAGALINLLPYISEEKTPNLYAHVQKVYDDVVSKDEDGNDVLYIIPNYGITYNDQIQMACNGPAFFIQKQVLAWAGYPQIKTLNEYFDLIEKFVAANPTDKNGNPYEGFAILCEGWRHFCLINPVQHLMGQPNEGEVFINRETAEVETFINKDYAKPYYKKLNEMFNKGLINKDTFVMNYDQYIAKLSSGTVLGMFDQTWDFGSATDALNAAKMYENTYIALPLVYDESYGYGVISEQYLNGAVPNKDRGFGISVNCEYPERMVNLFENLLSDKWQKLLQWGIEGEDYTVTAEGRMVMTKEQYEQRSDATWKKANMAPAIWESAPKKQGTQDDGNAWAPADQDEMYFDLMNDYDKAFLAAYGYKKPADFFNAPCELAPWGEAWQIDKSPIQDDYDDFLLIQDQDLPKIIMSADDAEFEANWAAFVERIAPSAAVHDAHMQAEVNKLIGK